MNQNNKLALAIALRSLEVSLPFASLATAIILLILAPVRAITIICAVVSFLTIVWGLILLHRPAVRHIYPLVVFTFDSFLFGLWTGSFSGTIGTYAGSCYIEPNPDMSEPGALCTLGRVMTSFACVMMVVSGICLVLFEMFSYFPACKKNVKSAFNTQVMDIGAIFPAKVEYDYETKSKESLF